MRSGCGFVEVSLNSPPEIKETDLKKATLEFSELSVLLEGKIKSEQVNQIIQIIGGSKCLV